MKGSNRRDLEVGEELNVSRKTFQVLFTLMPDPAAIVDANGKFLAVNRKLEEVTGFKREELLGKNFARTGILTAESEAIVMKNLAKRMAGIQVAPYEIETLTKDGEKRLDEINAARIEYGGEPAALAVFRDITERKRMEEALRRSEEQYRTLHSNIPVGLYRNSPGPRGRFLAANPAITSMFGYSSVEEFLQTNVSDLYETPEDRKVFSERLSREGKVSRVELRLKKRDGTPLWGAVSAQAMKDEQGNILHFDGMIEDITERKRMEEALKESEQRFRTVFDNAGDGILVADVETKKFFLGNRVICQMLGYSQEEVKKLGVLDIHPKKDLPYVIERFEKLASQEIQVAENIPVQRKDGSVLLADIASSPFVLNGKTYLIGVFRDMTERKRMEEELRQRVEEIKALNEGISQRLIQKISQIDNISEVKERLRKIPDLSTGLDLILDTAIRDLEMDVGAVLIVDREENALKMRGFKSRIEGMKVDENYPLYLGFAELEAVKESKSVSKIVGEGELSILKTASIHCAPIRFGKEVYGVVAFGSQKALSLDSSDLAVLDLYAELASTLFETERLTITPMKETAKVAKRRFQLELGRSYLVKNDVEKAFEVFADHVLSGMEGLCITREFPPNVRRKYGLEKTPIVWLTEERAKGEMTVDSLQDLSILIQRFLENAKQRVVLLDGFEYLTTKSGFEPFIGFLQLNRSRFERSESILIAPILEEALDLREAKLVEREMKPLTAE